MLQSKQRLLQLNAKLAETLTSKGVTSTADETTTALVNKVGDIASGDTIYFSKDGRTYTKNIILPEYITSIGQYAYQSCVNLESITIPDSVTSIYDYAFRGCSSLISITIPNGVTRIGNGAFSGCSSLTSITIPNGVTRIGGYAFSGCSSLTSITIPNSVTSIYDYAFRGCSSLISITIPSSVTSIGSSAFYSCANLISVIIGNGFNANNLNLSVSTLYTRETIVSWLNALADRTGQTAYTLTIGATNLAKLTEQDILIATNKNWTLS